MTDAVLYLGSEQARLYRVEGDRLLDADAAPGTRNLSVVVDFVEESLVRVSLPRVFGRDMAALVERRLQQEFRETPYRCSLKLGNSATPKHADYLFQGLPVAARLDGLLKPWLEAKAAIRGVYSLSMLASHWTHLRGGGGEIRLIVVPTPAGMRYILLDRGQAVLSRLTSAPDLDQEHGAQALAEEIERTVQYLYNARLVGRGSEIPTWIWGAQPACRALAERRIGGLRIEDTPADSRLGNPGQEGVEVLLRLAALRPPAQQLAPAGVRLFHAAAHLRKGLLTGGVITAAALLGLAGLTFVEAQDLRQQLGGAAAIRDEVHKTELALSEQASLAAVDVETVRDATRTFRQEIESLPDPGDTLIRVSRVFDGNPAYRIDRLAWQVSAPQAPADSADACPEPWQPDPETGERPTERRAGLRLQGEVDRLLSLREAVAARNAFEDDLRASAGLRLRSAAVPIDISGEGVIRGGGSGASDSRSFDYCLSSAAGSP